MVSLPIRTLAILATVLPLLALAACGGDEGIARSAPAAVEPPGPVSWRVVDGGPDDAFVSVRPDGRDHPCVAYQPKARETEGRVTITVVKDERGCVGDTSASKEPPVLRVNLDRAVGGREIRDSQRTG